MTIKYVLHRVTVRDVANDHIELLLEGDPDKMVQAVKTVYPELDAITTELAGLVLFSNNTKEVELHPHIVY